MITVEAFDVFDHVLGREGVGFEECRIWGSKGRLRTEIWEDREGP